MPDEPILAILVHGTWGSKSEWTQLSSAEGTPSFRTRLDQQLDGRVVTERFPWSDRNRQAARRIAAADLAKTLRAALVSGKYQHVVVIAHSHGGNIAHAAVSILPDRFAQRVDIVTLATPFIIERSRFSPNVIDVENASNDGFKSGFIATFGLWCVFCLLPVLMYLTGWNPLELTVKNYARPYDYWVGELATQEGFAWVMDHLWAWSTIGTVLLLVVAFFVSIVIVVSVGARMAQKKRSSARSLREVRFGQNHLAIAHSSDEAVMGLQILCNSLNLLHLSVYSIVRFAWRVVSYKDIFLYGSTLSLGALFVVGYVARAVLSLAMLLRFFDSEWGYTLLRYVTLVAYPIAIFAIALGTLFGAVVISSYALIALFGFFRYVLLLLSGVTNIGTRRGAMFRLLFGEFSITVSPFGVTRVSVIPGSRIINHTSIYEEPDVLTQVVNEIVSKRHGVTALGRAEREHSLDAPLMERGL